MPQYVSGVDISNVTLGAGAAAAITTGIDNVLLGAGAGRDITTGCGNIVIGSAAGSDPNLTNNIILSTIPEEAKKYC